MSLGARILWIDLHGRVLASWPGQEPPRSAEAMVVVADELEPRRQTLAGLAAALAAAGTDALCRVEPVVDALVELDGTALVERHLERDRHVRSTVPQVVAAGWWPRLAESVEAGAAAGVPIDLANLVATLGGRVATLEDGAIEVD